MPESAPRFSVIVPAHQVQAHLPACLASVLTQDFRDVQLIAVDDASPDACREIIAEAAAADPRVLGLTLPRNAGPGPARNAALPHATGSYVLFLDGDDLLTPGALAALDARLTAAGEPQLLLFDHARLSWDGEVTPGVPAGLLATAGAASAPGNGAAPRTFTLGGRPSLLGLPPVAWGAAYRRDLLTSAGLRFPAGHYQDLPFFYAALAAAGSIAVLDRVCVRHRRRRQGGRARSAGRGHFDVLDQYERTFARLGALPGGDRWRPALHRLMVAHLTAVHRELRGVLPGPERAEFLRSARALCRTHRAASGSTALGAGRGSRPRRGLPAALGLPGAGLRGLRRLARRGGAGLRAALLRVHYLLQLRRPLDRRLAVFAGGTGEDAGYAGHPAALEARLRELEPGFTTAWVTGPGPGPEPPPGVRRLVPGTAAYLGAVARAGFLVSGGPFPDALVPRAGQRRLQTHAGTPLAHAGLDAPGRDLAGLLRQIDRWDHCLSAGRHATLAWESAYPAAYQILEYGSPRADLFHAAGAEDVRAARGWLGVPPGVLAVLYAPAPRSGRQETALPAPERLAARLGPGFLLLVRGGPHRASGPGVLDVTGHPAGLEWLCLAADALVTDYAPVVFDYAVLNRPVVVHAEDWEGYRAVHGAYVDLPAVAPGPVTRDEDELVAALRGTELWTGAESAARREAFRRRFCPYDDGFAAERVVRRVFLDGRRVPPVVPVEARRPAPAAVTVRAEPRTPAPRPRPRLHAARCER
ncbi:CDP-glycerol glycerophosphotransferase family protein [Streptomyces sp. DSM 44917]|uniref:CDP-glycerol glycerophosphotransferase family protein n=1 Tax=Streptomyces boetiae TaxID=3075541 RepID=A0ABU2LFP9_9ACTN|nr:CDP-glycerol glycerophosphotransferase family protein [Streptomyces sp. DSM 44917]MDT0309998.1 CDP-glycerol glycerophosphotransferase family protein [Streptomyces sp. DSM 44917]